MLEMVFSTQDTAFKSASHLSFPEAQEQDLFILPTTSESLLNERRSTQGNPTGSPFVPGSNKPLSPAESIIRQVTGYALWRCLGRKAGSGASVLHLPRQSIRAMTKPQEKHTVLLSKDEPEHPRKHLLQSPPSLPAQVQPLPHNLNKGKHALWTACHLLFLHRCSVLKNNRCSALHSQLPSSGIVFSFCS